MPALNKLTDRAIKNATSGKKYNDGGGLWFVKRKDGGGQWVFRFSLHGKRPEMGLGAYPDISLKDARIAASECRKVVGSGLNPIKEKARLAREAAKELPTLSKMAGETFEARKRQLVGDGKAGRWESPLRLHVLPRIGSIPIEEIDQTDIKNTLSPIWHKKQETARKAISRLGLVFQHAAAAGYDVDLQVTQKAKALLGAQGDKPKHIPSLDWREVPAFYESLAEDTITHLALKLLILTASRSTPIRFLKLDQIHGDTWIVPAENMKALRGKKEEFRIPLSKEAQKVIKEASKYARNGFVFPNVNRGVISDATMARLMERRGMDARPHGFRSSFRTWCAEATDTSREVAETALAHLSGSKVERAYRRTDFLEQRRVLMERWADYLLTQDSQPLRLLA